MSLSKLYHATLLAHNRAPRNHGELPAPTHSARGTDALCGDDIRVWLRVEDDRICDASWSGDACAVTTATASMLTDWMRGRSLDEFSRAHRLFDRLLTDPEQHDVEAFGDLNVLRAVTEFPSRRRNALLPWETARTALKQGRQPELTTDKH